VVGEIAIIVIRRSFPCPGAVPGWAAKTDSCNLPRPISTAALSQPFITLHALRSHLLVRLYLTAAGYFAYTSLALVTSAGEPFHAFGRLQANRGFRDIRRVNPDVGVLRLLVIFRWLVQFQPQG